MKIGPGLKTNSFACWSKMRVPVMSDGIRSGVNWMRLKSAETAAAQGAHEQGLGRAGDAFEQHMAVGEQPGERVLDGLVLADDGLVDFARDGLGDALHLAAARVIGGRRRRLHRRSPGGRAVEVERGTRGVVQASLIGGALRETVPLPRLAGRGAIPGCLVVRQCRFPF